MFDVHKVKVELEDGKLHSGYLVELGNTLLFNYSRGAFGGSTKIFTIGSIEIPDISYISDQWNENLMELIRKETFFDPWGLLEEKGFTAHDGEINFSCLIHNSSNLSVNFIERDGDLVLEIKDNALEALYEAAGLYLDYVDEGLTWDDELLKKVFSTKKGEDCVGLIEEVKNIDELFRLAQRDWGQYENLEIMKVNMIKEKT